MTESRPDVLQGLLAIVCEATGISFAAVIRVVDGRQIVSAFSDQVRLGLTPGCEFPPEVGVGREGEPPSVRMVVCDLASENNDQTPDAATSGDFRSYVSRPIPSRSGSLLGTLYSLRAPTRGVHVVEPEAMITMLAELLALSLEQADTVANSEACVASHREAAQLREQFIAVMSHDLRNPLAAILSGINLLGKQPAPERAELILTQMRSSVTRMTSLIADVLDLSRSRLAGGMTVRREPTFIDPIIVQIVAELASTHPDHMISAECHFDRAIDCDPHRLAQLLSNLLGNALTHGASDQPVRILCDSDETDLLLSVTNGGRRISPEAMPRLFEPFVQGRAGPDKNGLGLGLYIAAQIAAAHDGSLTATSTDLETCFTFRMPMAASTLPLHRKGDL